MCVSGAEGVTAQWLTGMQARYDNSIFVIHLVFCQGLISFILNTVQYQLSQYHSL